MKKISGYVLVKETNSGVPNVVVTAYDCERSALAGAATRQSKQDTSVGDFGKRIGSVLTDQDGKFVLTAEDLEFPGNEARPDLLIAVFAPEDIHEVEKPVPLPPEKRLLYISSVPMTDAGAEEALVIRLLQAQLDKFQIPVGVSTSHRQAEGRRLASVMESAWTFRDSLKTSLRPRLQEEQKRSDSRKKVAAQQVKNLSAIPLHLRDDALVNNKLLIKSREDLERELKPKQDQAIADGLKRLARHAPTAHLWLSDSDLAGFGIKREGQRTVGKLDAAKLAGKLRSLSGGVDLVKVRGLNAPSPDELEKRYLLSTAGRVTPRRSPKGRED